MAKKTRNPPLQIVPNADERAAAGPQPSRSLGEHGQRLWNRIVAEYEVEDSAVIELLTQTCLACDRAEELAAHVARDGAIVRTTTGIKTHPAIREELSCRGFVVRTLQRIGLTYEPLRAGPGRPPNSADFA